MDPQLLQPYPPLSTVERLILHEKQGNCIPVYVQLPADLLTPCIAYMRLSKDAKYSFLLESVLNGENLGRYSFIGADPLRVIKTGPTTEYQGDPLAHLQRELASYKYIKLPEVPTFTGGAVGYVSYDCIGYFEPKIPQTLQEKGIHLRDTLKIPEAVFMIADTVVIYDHIFQNVKVVAHVFVSDLYLGANAGTSGSVSSTASVATAASSPAVVSSSIKSSAANLSFIYQTAVSKARRIAKLLLNTPTPTIPQPSIPFPPPPSSKPVSNVGEDGYKSFVSTLKQHIVKGDIIQAVPSQRIRRPTKVHPFNVYRQLRQVNPSPYMFYLDCGEVKVVGASPETLCKVEAGKVFNHAIAGTVKRGRTPEEDERLSSQLLSSQKDRAEHIMLVDLARNDLNRVCIPKTVSLPYLMRLEKFSHVTHLTSQITGMLRPPLTRFDAFRSIFPAGTVSGAPKLKAIELVYGLEREKRGVYAGAVGRWDFAEDEMDTCIAIRTMVFKTEAEDTDDALAESAAQDEEGAGASTGSTSVAYLQAGGGIVFDSVEEEEYEETVNKLGGNLRAVEDAEEYWSKMQRSRATNS